MCRFSIASWVRKHFRKLRTCNTSSVKSFLSGSNYPVGPLGCGHVYPSIISKCFPRISVVFSVCFLVFGAVVPLQIKTLSERILLATSQDPVRIELSVFLWHFSFDTHYLLNCYSWLNITSLLPQCTSSNLTRKLITVHACNKDKK